MLQYGVISPRSGRNGRKCEDMEIGLARARKGAKAMGRAVEAEIEKGRAVCRPAPEGWRAGDEDRGNEECAAQNMEPEEEWEPPAPKQVEDKTTVAEKRKIPQHGQRPL